MIQGGLIYEHLIGHLVNFMAFNWFWYARKVGQMLTQNKRRRPSIETKEHKWTICATNFDMIFGDTNFTKNKIQNRL